MPETTETTETQVQEQVVGGTPEDTESPETPVVEEKGLTPEEQSAKDKAWAETQKEKERADRLEAELEALRQQKPAQTVQEPQVQQQDPVAKDLEPYWNSLSRRVDAGEMTEDEANSAWQFTYRDKVRDREHAELRNVVNYLVAQQVGQVKLQEFKGVLTDTNAEVQKETEAILSNWGININNPAAFAGTEAEKIKSLGAAAKALAKENIATRHQTRPTHPGNIAMPSSPAVPPAPNAGTPNSIDEVTQMMIRQNPG